MKHARVEIKRPYICRINVYHLEKLRMFELYLLDRYRDEEYFELIFNEYREFLYQIDWCK